MPRARPTALPRKNSDGREPGSPHVTSSPRPAPAGQAAADRATAPPNLNRSLPPSTGEDANYQPGPCQREGRPAPATRVCDAEEPQQVASPACQGAASLQLWGARGSPIGQKEPLPASRGCWFGAAQGRRAEWRAEARTPRRAPAGTGAPTALTARIRAPTPAPRAGRRPTGARSSSQRQGEPGTMHQSPGTAKAARPRPAPGGPSFSGWGGGSQGSWEGREAAGPLGPENSGRAGVPGPGPELR